MDIARAIQKQKSFEFVSFHGWVSVKQVVKFVLGIDQDARLRSAQVLVDFTQQGLVIAFGADGKEYSIQEGDRVVRLSGESFEVLSEAQFYERYQDTL